MSAAADFEVILHFTREIADKLDLRVEELPPVLDRGQIARVARLKDARCLASSAERGARKRHPRWLAFRATVGLGIHKVPTVRVARWLAVYATALPMPCTPGPNKEGSGASLLQGAWPPAGRRIHRCEG